MTVTEALARLEALSDPKMKAHNRKDGVGDNQFGAKKGDIRKLAKEIKSDPDLALELWETENYDARLLAVLLWKPKGLSKETVDGLVRSASYEDVADWFNNTIVKKHPEKESLRQVWMRDKDPWAARAGWALTDERIYKAPDGLDLDALLDRIESEMGEAAPQVQWMMNFCLVAIGIQFPENRARAIAIGDTLGVYRDYPTSKGCTSPFAPIWIAEMVRRQG